ncbi:dihydrodipicolinate synthase family protein [Candidatus Omnitrophota bacterium]
MKLHQSQPIIYFCTAILIIQFAIPVNMLSSSISLDSLRPISHKLSQRLIDAPTQIGEGDDALPLPNRKVAQPMERSNAIDGHPSELTFESYADLAKGGWGIVGIEATAVEPMGRFAEYGYSRARYPQLRFGPEYAEGLRKKVEHIRVNSPFGDKQVISIQPNHSGSISDGRYSKVLRTYLPRKGDPDNTPGELLMDEDVEPIIESFVRAAKMAYDAGINIVDVKACHGYLLSQFLRPANEERPGWSYGGSLKNRLRIVEEIISRIRDEVPDKKFKIMVRFSVYEGDNMPGGIGAVNANSAEMSLTEPMLMGECFILAGADIINVTAGIPKFNADPWVRPTERPEGIEVQDEEVTEDSDLLLFHHFLFQKAFKDMLRGMRREDVAVIGSAYSVFREDSEVIAEDMLRKGFVDLIGYGRATLPADGECIQCSKCSALLVDQVPVGCTRTGKLYRLLAFTRGAVKIALLKGNPEKAIGIIERWRSKTPHFGQDTPIVRYMNTFLAKQMLLAVADAAEEIIDNGLDLVFDQANEDQRDFEAIQRVGKKLQYLVGNLSAIAEAAHIDDSGVKGMQLISAAGFKRPLEVLAKQCVNFNRVRYGTEDRAQVIEDRNHNLLSITCEIRATLGAASTLIRYPQVDFAMIKARRAVSRPANLLNLELAYSQDTYPIPPINEFLDRSRSAAYSNEVELNRDPAWTREITDMHARMNLVDKEAVDAILLEYDDLLVPENIVPVITPMKRVDGGIQIDRESIRSLLEYLKSIGVKSLLVMGATGEFKDLSNDQRIEAIRIFAEESKGDFKIFANATGDSEGETIKNIKIINDRIDHISAIVVAPLCYLHRNDQIASHIRGIKSKLPLILYNNPGIHKNVGSSIDPEVVGELNEYIEGIKDSSGDLNLLTSYTHHTRVYQGDEGTIYEALKRGAIGSVSSMGNCLGLPQQIFAAGVYINGLESLQNKIVEYRYALTAGGKKIPAALKHYLCMAGIIERPIVADQEKSLSDHEKDLVEEVLKEQDRVGALFLDKADTLIEERDDAVIDEETLELLIKTLESGKRVFIVTADSKYDALKKQLIIPLTTALKARGQMELIKRFKLAHARKIGPEQKKTIDQLYTYAEIDSDEGYEEYNLQLVAEPECEGIIDKGKAIELLARQYNVNSGTVIVATDSLKDRPMFAAKLPFGVRAVNIFLGDEDELLANPIEHAIVFAVPPECRYVAGCKVIMQDLLRIDRKKGTWRGMTAFREWRSIVAPLPETDPVPVPTVADMATAGAAAINAISCAA